CIGDDVTLAPLDAFTGIDAARAAAFGGRCALAVDDAGRGSQLAPLPLAGARHQPSIDPMPGAVVAPAVEIALHRRAWWEVLGQGAPLTPGGENVQNRLDDRSQIASARPPKPASGRQQRRDLGPLPIRRAACIAQSITPIVPPS